jgi:cardiolipin synthase
MQEVLCMRLSGSKHSAPVAPTQTSAPDAQLEQRDLDLADLSEWVHPKANTRICLERLSVNFQPTSNNDVEVLIDGAQVYPKMLDDLNSARDSIRIIQYGFKDGKIGRPVANILMEKAKTGIDVQLVVSNLGSQVSSKCKVFYSEMAAAGVKIVTNVGVMPVRKVGLLGGESHISRTSEELHCFEHRKIVVVDSRVAYTGGMGFEDSFVDQHHDVMIRIEGPCAKQLEALCEQSFQFYLRAQMPDVKRASDLPVEVIGPEQGRVTVIHNVPGVGWWKINEALFNAIENAHDTIWVMNPYLGDTEVTKKLSEAAQRGVVVRAIFAGAPENRFAKGKQRAQYASLLAAGVEIYHYPTLLHGKVLISDDKEVLVGSMNLDNLSTSRNFEIVVRLEDPKDIEFFKQELFEKDLIKCSRKFTRGHNVWSHTVDAVCGSIDRWFRP